MIKHSPFFPFFLIGTLAMLTAGGCSSTSSPDPAREAASLPTDGNGAGGSTGGNGNDDRSPSSATGPCADHGGTCEFDDGNAETDPCSATGRPVGDFACGKSDAGQFFCCLPARSPAPVKSECAQHGGTCELDDGTAEVDPCTGTSRPIGQFACGASDAGTYFCCLPK